MRISAYLDRELQFEEQRNFERHMNTCAICSATLRGVRQVRLALCGLGAADQSPSFKFRLCARLQEEGIRQRPRWVRPLALGVAIGAALAILLLPEPNQEEDQTAYWQGWGQNLQLLDRLPLSFQGTSNQRADLSGTSYSHAQVRMISY